MEVNRTADRIAAARQAGDTRPLVLIGYSRGANDAVRLTRRLQKQGISVDTLVLMEMATQDSVPANVISCLNVYKSSRS
jgi:thioesterase domain-containing protein